MNVLVGMSVAGLVGSNIVSRTTNMFVQKGMDTVSFFRSGSSSSENISAALRKIEELDIKIKIKVLQKFLSKYNPKMSNKLSVSSEVVGDICEDVDKIVDKCCTIIQKIEHLALEHDAKWLKRYRTFDVSSELTDLELYNNILKNRIEMLLIDKID